MGDDQYSVVLCELYERQRTGLGCDQFTLQHFNFLLQMCDLSACKTKVFGKEVFLTFGVLLITLTRLQF